jgi:hypothetical protein
VTDRGALFAGFQLPISAGGTMNHPFERMLAAGFAGLVATVPMSVLMLLGHRRLPWTQRDPLPPAQITANAAETVGLDDDLSPGQMSALTIANHFGYGTAMGSIYGLLTSRRESKSPLSSGIGYGMAVWGASYLGWLPSLGLYRSATQEPPGRNLLMLSAHVLWGGSLGLLTEVAARRMARQRTRGSSTFGPLGARRTTTDSASPKLVEQES